MADKKHMFSFLLSNRIHTLIKFGVTGVSGLVIDFLLTWFFKDELHINKFVANAIGFSTAVTSNYIINRQWTFKDKQSKAVPQFVAFLAVSLIGLMLNSSVIFLFNTLLSVNFYLSKAVAVFIVFFWNFSLNYFFVFKSAKEI